MQDILKCHQLSFLWESITVIISKCNCNHENILRLILKSKSIFSEHEVHIVTINIHYQQNTSNSIIFTVSFLVHYLIYNVCPYTQTSVVFH